MDIDYRKKFLYTLVLVAAIGAIYFLRHEIAGLYGGTHLATGQKPANGKPAKERKIKYWTDAMIPGYRAAGPGKSPMGMDLTPVYEDEDQSADAGVKIHPELQQSLGVRTHKAGLREVSKTIRASGIISYDERKVANIQSKVTGWVEKLYVDFTGQKVLKGDYLLEIYSPDLVATEEEFLLAIRSREISTKNTELDLEMRGDEMYQAARNRLLYLDVPEHQIWDLEQKRLILKTLHIHSPYAGVVVSKPVFVGMQVTPGMTLYTVADLSSVWVMADVYEYEVGGVKVGDKAALSLPAYPGRKFTGVVSYINPFMDKEARTVKVRMEFANPHLELKPEMYANVEISAGKSRKAVTVPKEAVIRGGKHDIVIIARGGGLYDPREVTLGVEGRDYFEIASGLYEGETVVASANFLIDSESNLREATQKMLSTDGRPAQTPTPAEPASQGDSGMKGTETSGMKMDNASHGGSPEPHGHSHAGAHDMEHMDHSGMKMGNMEMPSAGDGAAPVKKQSHKHGKGE